MSVDYNAPPPRYPLTSCVALMLGLFLLVAVGSWLALQYLPWAGGSGLNPQAPLRPVAARGDLSSAEKMNIEVYNHNANSVAHVTNLAEQRDWSRLNVQEVPKGTGSGWVWDQDGHIVTNYHVVQGASAARVMLSDHTTYQAQTIWAYPEKDIAVITINAAKDKLHPIQRGSSHGLKVGQITFAIGDPFGLDQTLTNGIISALGRDIEAANGKTIQGVIQTSAAINPGNSGGPLLDSDGKLIGMNTAILSPSGAFAGIGFAIPVDEISQVVPQLIEHGKVVRPRLGVQIAEDQVAEQLGVDQGALILKVLPDSPAAAAGLQGTRRTESGQIRLGDIIVAIDGQAVNNGKDLRSVLDGHKVGDTVTVTIVRAGQRQDVKVKLEQFNG